MTHKTFIKRLIFMISVLALSFGLNPALAQSSTSTSTSTSTRASQATGSSVGLPMIPALKVSVTDAKFGAVPSATVNNTAAIQKALDYVNAKGGGTITFPPGTYLVSVHPATNGPRALTLYSKIRLKALIVGQASTIKLADNQGNYESVMATDAFATELSDIEFNGMTFDSNGQNNIYPIAANFPPGTNFYANYFIRSYFGHRARITGATFLNCDCINTVTFNGQPDANGVATMTDVVIEKSAFKGTGSSGADHDHSSIYFLGDRALVSLNTFSSRNGVGTKGARTAIEMHDGGVRVSDNMIDGYTQGVNAVGRAEYPAAQTYSHNMFNNVASGINIWSCKNIGCDVTGNPSGPAFTSLTLSNNTINIDASGWQNTQNIDYGVLSGIHFEAGKSAAPVTRLNIVSNTITYTTYGSLTRDQDLFSVGIGLQGFETGTTRLQLSTIVVTGNTIRNAIGPCIKSTAVVGGTTLSSISTNTLIDCGRSTNFGGDFHTLRSGIFIYGASKRLAVTGNSIGNTAATGGPLEYGIYIDAPCTNSDRCSVKTSTVTNINPDNRVFLTGNATGWVKTP